jgi:hypothetical protein
VRRIDWRFLLPDPNLGRTAYLGPSSDTLLAALKPWCRSLTVVPLSLDRDPDIGDAYELVVLRASNVAMLKQATPLVRPTGYLYWEVDRSPTASGPLGSVNQPWQEALRLRDASRYCELVERLGFDDVRVSWHRPNFESCLEIVPLGEPMALRYCLSRRHARPSGRVKAAAGRSLMAVGLLTRMLSCISVVGRKRASNKARI